MSACGRILSGEMHYARIPRACWRDRLAMARAMGLNAVSTYVFWNKHEPQPGTYDFSGENDVAEYVRAAQAEGLHVILRPGPYVCAEWDFGGLPAWLLRDGPIAVRTSDAAYMGPVKRWLMRLGQELAGLQRAHGGPIVAVQLENEYGAFGSDRAYLHALRDAMQNAGFSASPLFTIDQPGDLAAGSLDDVPIAVTFAPGDPAHIFERLRSVRPDAPLLAGEYWAGWFDHWGEARARIDDSQQVRDLQWMLAQDAGVNIYMFHGGTTFGFWNGANSDRSHPYQPTVTSYDYEAALDEAGRPTPKYFAFRRAIEAATGSRLPAVPPAPQLIDVPEFSLDEAAPLSAAQTRIVTAERPLPMEALGQNFGYILYRTRALSKFDAVLRVEHLRDYAAVTIDGTCVGYLDRRDGSDRLHVSGRAGSLIEILAENAGRINYGPDLRFERKGIDGRVFLGDEELRGWEIAPLPLERISDIVFEPGAPPAPAFYRGTFTLERPGDTFFDVRSLGKGALWINGHNAGRFWNEGPQRTLFVPGVWLRKGQNEAIALDLFQTPGPRTLQGGTRGMH